jgi:hypothetical protein
MIEAVAALQHLLHEDFPSDLSSLSNKRQSSATDIQTRVQRAHSLSWPIIQSVTLVSVKTFCQVGSGPYSRTGRSRLCGLLSWALAWRWWRRRFLI